MPRDPVHIPGLDAWRAALLLGGVLLHGSIGLPSSTLFDAIDVISQTFRMGVFFAIAGMLGAITIDRRGADAWLRSRLIRLGIPLIFGMTLIPPSIWMMTSLYGWAGPVKPLPFEWFHLWFLVALTLYSVVLHKAITGGVVARAVAFVEDRPNGGRRTAAIAILATACASAMLFAVAPRLMAMVLPPRLFDAFRTIQLIAGYLPMFVLGALAIQAPTFGARLLAQWRTGLGVVVLVAVTYALWFGMFAPRMSVADAAPVTAYLRFVAGAICPPAAFVVILRSALRIRRIPPVLTSVAQASYTIYLLHLPLALAINLSLIRLGTSAPVSYAVAVIGSGTLSYLFHHGCVRRSRVLKLLVNGHVARPAPAAAPSGVVG